jgi:hypothetical protein
MPYVRMTVTISAGYHVTNTKGTAEEVCVLQEREMREDLDEKIRRLLAMAKVPPGIITWNCVPAKEPELSEEQKQMLRRIGHDEEKPSAQPPAPPPSGMPQPIHRERDPRVKAELNHLKHGAEIDKDGV